MSKSQFEEITMGISIIITLLAYIANIDWLFYIFLVKSVWDFYCAMKYSYIEVFKGGGDES